MTNSKAVAVVGVGAILPDAPDVPTFWNNIKAGRYSITDVPAGRWDTTLYFNPDPKVPDKTYTKIGAWVRSFEFEPLKWGIPIPPRLLESMDLTQIWAIAATHQALLDYGYPQHSLDPNRVAVILGNAMGGENHYNTTLRIRSVEFVEALESVEAFQDLPAVVQQALVQGIQARIQARFPMISEDTMPGELANITAGRVANVFNFTGPNFITDAACASSMAALQTAMQGLSSYQFDAVLTGGVDHSMGPESFVKFSKIGALSPDGSRPYAAGANGFVMGEGATIFLLKRLEDAEQAGDRIYAIIRAVGGSSDGRGKGITAPNPLGQQRAIERAWKNAGISPASVGLIEGHGTSTQVGDVTEVSSLNNVFGNLGLPVGSIALGSVKSNIGHLKSASGAAGMLKAMLALHEKVLPPSTNFECPNPQIDFAHMPFQVITELHPWPKPVGEVRRAGISSFGFGGANFHVVAEEYIPGLLSDEPHPFPGVEVKSTAPQNAAPAPYAGLLFLGADSVARLRTQLVTALEETRQGTLQPSRLPSPAEIEQPERLVFGYASQEELLKQGEKALKAFENESPAMWQALAAQGAFRGSGHPGKLAFLFSGQGSQYVNMLRDLRDVDPMVAATFREADEIMTPIFGRPLTSYIYVEGDEAGLKQAEENLRDTTITQPAVLTADVAMLRVLQKFGFQPDMVIGHSLGEYAALVAAGVLTFAEALEVVSARGREMVRVSMKDNGCMAAVSAPLNEVERLLKTVEGYVVIANVNSPVQSVIGGTTAAVEAAIVACQAAGFQAVRIPVSHAFHTRIVAPASEPLRQVISRMNVQPPRLPIAANVTGQLYPSSREEILDLLARQVASPVQFIQGIETLYNNGARTFVEVGPKRVLNALAVDIFKGRNDVSIMATNHPRKGGVPSLHDAMCGLLAAGYKPVASTGISEVPHIVALQRPAVVLVENASCDSSEIQTFVLGLVSEKTGYPVEMLDPGLDLEADLGIDTIKQAELFVSVREYYGIPRREDLRLVDYNTLQKVINFVRESRTSAEAPEVEAPVEPAAAIETVLPTELMRRVPVPVLRPRLDLCKPTDVNLSEGSRVLIIADQGKVAAALARKLRSLGVEVALQKTGIEVDTDPFKGQPVDGVYFLPAADEEPYLTDLTAESWQNLLEERMLKLACLMQVLTNQPFLVCATRCGGLNGYETQGANAPLGGLVSGFTKALAWERPQSLVKVVDFEATALATEVAAHLLEETRFDPSAVEVGWQGSQRFSILLVEQPLPSNVVSDLPERPVFLVSGGTAGIIAPVVIDLAQRTRGTFYLLGRRPLPAKDHPDLIRLQSDRLGLKKDILRQTKADEKPSLAQAEEKLAALERAAATLRTMDNMRAIGAQVEYIACDVTNPVAVENTVEQVLASAGHVDVFIHAAGVEYSRRLERKTQNEIEQTLAVKATGFFHLYHALAAHKALPNHILTFSSVAGRFGNAGQTDYSAANDLLCRLMSGLRRQHPEIKAQVIDWGAWAEVGMASRGRIPELMKRAGIEMLSMVTAAPMVYRELAFAPAGEVVIAGSLGELDAQRDADGSLDLERGNNLLT